MPDTLQSWTRRTVAGLALFVAPAAILAESAQFERTLNVTGTPVISVSTGSGFIHINPGSDGQVHIIGHVHSSNGWFGGSSGDEVKQAVDDPPIDQAGSTIRIGGHDHNYHHISIDYEITAPRSSQVKAVTGSGDVQVSNINASKLSTGSGDIQADGLSGDVALDTGSGNIHVAFAKSGMVTAGTGSGNIQLQNVRGGLKAGTGSGDIKISGEPSDNWKLETGSGSVDLTVGNARMTLDASTGSGNINTAQPIAMQGSLTRHHVTGNINGGGPTVRVETGSGDIRIH